MDKTQQPKKGLHTPLPWYLSPQKKFIRANGVHGWNIAAIEDQPPYSEANAELIVKSVNERQALLDANKKMREALEAIVARLNGEFDNPSLLLFGELSDSETDDIEGFAKDALSCCYC